MTLIEIVQKALKEDLPKGDLTTDALGWTERKGLAQLIAKEDLILSGQEFFAASMHQLDSENQIQWQFKDGDLVLKEQTVATISGNLIPILKAERVGLNFLGHFSGIATFTRCFVYNTEGTKCKILDTPKSLPLFRQWERKAVRDGSGYNHRMNLSTSILIKENHIRLAGGLTNAVGQIRVRMKETIEVECRTLEEVETAIHLKVPRILLDNMDNETIKSAMEKIPAGVEVGASGNISVERIQSVAQLGVH